MQFENRKIKYDYSFDWAASRAYYLNFREGEGIIGKWLSIDYDLKIRNWETKSRKLRFEGSIWRDV